jgi:hypothetical protein
MKSVLSLLLLPLLSGELYAQVEPTVPAKPDIQFEVKSHRVVPLQDGTGRKLILEEVKPPVFPPPPAVVPPAPVDPAVRAALRAAWALEAKKERRMLSLTGIYYPNGQTFLQWFTPGPDGQWQIYEAWTLTDFRSAWLVQEFEVGDAIYDIFPSVFPASKWDTGRVFPGPLYFPEGSPGFRLVKGDPTHVKSIAPIAALHEIYRQEGQQLTAQWLAIKSTQEMEDARLKENPPPGKDIVVRFWPRGKYRPSSNLGPAPVSHRR